MCLKNFGNMADMEKGRKKSRILGMGLLLFLLVAGMSVSCSSTRGLCPAYGSKYKVEPLPY